MRTVDIIGAETLLPAMEAVVGPPNPTWVMALTTFQVGQVVAVLTSGAVDTKVVVMLRDSLAILGEMAESFGYRVTASDMENPHWVRATMTPIPLRSGTNREFVSRSTMEAGQRRGRQSRVRAIGAR
jgi:hypothetical protein